MATVSTGTLTVNAAFLQEIKEVHQELWCLLAEVRGMCEDPAGILKRRKKFRELFEVLRDQLALHFALEEAYGYFEDPVDVAPRLCDRALALRDEHRRLYVQITALEHRVRDSLEHHPNRARVLGLIREFEDFDEDFRRHEEAENELIQQEYGDDIGVGD